MIIIKFIDLKKVMLLFIVKSLIGLTNSGVEISKIKSISRTLSTFAFELNEPIECIFEFEPP